MSCTLGQSLRQHACLRYGAPQIVAINVSPGGIPKTPKERVYVAHQGLAGDGRNHAKHLRADRAVSLFDLEVLHDLREEGYPLVPGAIGENLTVVGVRVQRLTPGDRLLLGDVVLELTEPRKPCYVLDAIDPRLKDVIIGRCGYLASVVREGVLSPGMEVRVQFGAALGPGDVSPLRDAT